MLFWSAVLDNRVENLMALEMFRTLNQALLSHRGGIEAVLFLKSMETLKLFLKFFPS